MKSPYGTVRRGENTGSPRNAPNGAQRMSLFAASTHALPTPSVHRSASTRILAVPSPKALKCATIRDRTDTGGDKEKEVGHVSKNIRPCSKRLGKNSTVSGNGSHLSRRFHPVHGEEEAFSPTASDISRAEGLTHPRLQPQTEETIAKSSLRKVRNAKLDLF